MENTPDGIYLLCSDQDGISESGYGTLCLSGVISQHPLKSVYSALGGKILEVGGYVKYSSDDDFEMNLNCACRICLPKDTAPARLTILSDKINKIQINGECNFEIQAKDCRFERIHAGGRKWSMVNTQKNTVNYNQLFNCEITRGQSVFLLSPVIGSTETRSGDLRAVVAVADDSDSAGVHSESLNWLVMRDCVVNDVSLEGSVSADNCMFILGKNTMSATASLLCGSHSRLTNCIFDGHTGITSSNFSARDPFKDIPLLSECVIDLAGTSDVLIDGCTFLAFKAKNGKVPSLIRVSADGDAASLPTDAAELENYVGPVRGISIHNCFFDLPDFTGCGISVSNVVADASAEQQEANYRVTLIDGNYVEMPMGHAFVWCPEMANNLTVRNNSGCQNNALVLVGNGDNSSTAVKRLQNAIIEGNILRYQRYIPGTKNPSDKTENEDEEEKYLAAGMCILKGVSCHNLTLSGNTVYGAVWDMCGTELDNNVTGLLRVIDNESIEETLFRNTKLDMGTNLIISPESTFFSGNVSDGEKTDFGSLGLDRDSNLVFIGRQYFDTYYKKFGVYTGQKWEYV